MDIFGWQGIATLLAVLVVIGLIIIMFARMTK